MARFRLSTTLAIAIILICTIYWLQHTEVQLEDAGAYAPGYYKPRDDAIMKEADGGGSKTRFVKSHSAGKYDRPKVNTEPEVEEEEVSESRQEQANTRSSADIAHRDAQYAAQLEDATPSTTSSTSTKTQPALVAAPAGIPPSIWQSSSSATKSKYADSMRLWKNININKYSKIRYEYNWVSEDGDNAFVRKHFASTRPSLMRFWNRLSSSTKLQPDIVPAANSSATQIQASLLRYMIMLSEGGVYSDIQTTALREIEGWTPNYFKAMEISAIVGICYDDKVNNMHVRPISFCDYTFAAAPGHPIFARAVNRVISNLESTARRHNVDTPSQLALSAQELDDVVGSGMLTDVVREVMQDQIPDEEITWDVFHGLQLPKVFGDVLVLPINGFASNQQHSHSGELAYGDKLVQKVIHTDSNLAKGADHETVTKQRKSGHDTTNEQNTGVFLSGKSYGGEVEVQGKTY